MDSNLLIIIIIHYYSRIIIIIFIINIKMNDNASGYNSKDTINSYKPLLMVNAGDHWDRNISRHMLPLLFMFG